MKKWGYLIYYSADAVEQTNDDAIVITQTKSHKFGVSRRLPVSTLPHAGFPSPVREFLKISLRCPNTLWTSKNDGPNKLWTTAKHDDDVHFGC